MKTCLQPYLTLFLLVIASLLLSKSAGSEEQAKIGHSKLLDWVQELRSPDRIARDLAAQRLIQAGPRSLPAIRELLRQASPPATRLLARRVFSALVGLSPEREVAVTDRLSELFEEEQPDIRGLSRWVLEQGQAVEAYVLELLRREQDASFSQDLKKRLMTLAAVRDLSLGHNRKDRAIEVLTSLGEPVVKELSSVAEDEDLDPEWRAIAAERLFVMGGREALESGLRLTGSRSEFLLGLTIPFLCRNAPADRFVDVVDAIGPAVLEDQDVRSHIAQLGRRVSLSNLREYLKDDRPRVKGLTAFVLGERLDLESASPLTSLLRDQDPFVVRESALALGRLGDEDSLEGLSRTLTHQKPSVRRAAVEALAGCGGGGIPWIATALADQDPSVRASAARFLGQSGEEIAVDPLVATLGDADPTVLAEATLGLSYLTGESLKTSVVVSSDRQQREVRTAWTRWWEKRRKEEIAGAREDEDEEAEGLDPAVLLVADGARILTTLASTLKTQFRPYGDLKGQGGAEPKNLSSAAQARMEEVCRRKTGAEDHEGMALRLEEEEKEVLSHLLSHGVFSTPEDLARMVGTLPIEMEARDYILLIYEGAEAMVSSLGDRFTRLSTLEDPEGLVEPDQLPSIFGRGKSLGMFLKEVEGGLEVEFVMGLNPADRAGLRRGDRVISINGKLSSGLSPEELKKMMTEAVDLSVLRDGWTRPVMFHLEPDTQDPELLVTTALLPANIGYLRLQQFDLGCSQKLDWAVRKLEKEGATSLILDLRGNPGGTVVDAQAIVDLFVGKGETISTNWFNSSKKGQDHREEKLESTHSTGDRDFPLAVLVNECSASASEMTSGSLQDLGRAIVVGRTTWGKGIGQGASGVAGFPRSSIFGETRTSLNLRITMLEYFLPSGRSVQGVGVIPDVPVSQFTLLGERFEAVRRARTDGSLSKYVDGLLKKPDLALKLARYDEWDPELYPELSLLRERLSFEISLDLVRKAVREELRIRLSPEHPELAVVDVQEDDDVRAAVSALAPDLGIDLADVPEYTDLEE